MRDRILWIAVGCIIIGFGVLCMYIKTLQIPLVSLQQDTPVPIYALEGEVIEVKTYDSVQYMTISYHCEKDVTFFERVNIPLNSFVRIRGASDVYNGKEQFIVH